MLVFWCPGGPYLGFYQERGSTVRIVGYRTVTRTVEVWHDELIETKLPDRYVMIETWFPAEVKEQTFHVPEKEETFTRLVQGHDETETQYVQGHYETQEIWIPEHEEQHFVEVPGYYESRTVQEPGQWITKSVWYEGYWESYLVTRPADPRTGRIEVSYWDKRWIPGRWVTRIVWEEGRTRLKKFWVDTTWEYQTVVVPGQYRDHRVWVDGNFEDVQVWVPEHMEEYTVIVPAHDETKTINVAAYSKYVEVKIEGETKMVQTKWYEWEDVEFQEPIFGYADLPYTDNLELIEHRRGPEMVLIGEPEHDTLKIRNVPTGDEFVLDADYVGCAIRIGENQYVLPEKYWDKSE